MLNEIKIRRRWGNVRLDVHMKTLFCDLIMHVDLQHKAHFHLYLVGKSGHGWRVVLYVSYSRLQVRLSKNFGDISTQI